MKRLLLADDSQENLFLLRTFLAAHGFEVEVARDGAEALAKARSQPPDLIVSDILMPVMDGFALCRQWKADERLRRIPFVFYTATYTDAQDAQLARSLGADAFIRKPAEPMAFLLELRAALQPAPAEAASDQTNGPGDEMAWLREYSGVLLRKLQQKVSQLEETNRALENDMLARAAAEAALRELSGRLLRLQDEERRRIARELHDTTAQHLAALIMNLSLLAPRLQTTDPRVSRLLTDSLALAEKSSQEIRTLSYLLHPPLLEEVGLGGAVREYAEGFAKRSGVQVTLRLPAETTRLVNDDETALFRVVQESLGNIHRHAGSPVATIQFVELPEEVRLEVSDAGSGIPPEKLRHFHQGTLTGLGVGIAGMRERLRQLGGRLEVESTPRGTTVRAILPRRTTLAPAADLQTALPPPRP